MPLRLNDVAALVDAGLAAHISHDKPRFSASELLASPALHDLVESDFWRWFPVLTQDRTGTCTLLDEELRCRAYPSWPLSCARFPYSLNYAALTVFYAQSCQSRALLPPREAGPRVAALLNATIEAFNYQIRDMTLVHVAASELRELGLLEHLKLPRRLMRGLAPRGPAT